VKVHRRYKFVVEDWDRHGNVRVYLRLPGKQKIRLREEPGTPQFDAEYRHAAEGRMQPAPVRRRAAGSGTLRALCVAYYGSANYRQMEPRSRHVRQLILDKLCDQHGDKPAAMMEPRHVRRLRDERADTPEAANAIIKALRAVFRHGISDDLVSRNPARDVEYLRSGSDGFHTWTADEVAQFEARHPVGTKARLALALLLYTGQRRSDVTQLGRQHLKDDWLTFVQAKNRNRKPVRLSIPLLPELRDIIEATPDTGTSLSFLSSERGTPYSPDAFGNVFRNWCRQAGLPHCSAHGLRKAAASRLAELGASIHEIAAVTGHRSLKEVQRYTKGAEQKRLAATAMARLSSGQTAHKKSHSDVASPEWDENCPQVIEQKGAVSCMVPRGGIEPPTLRFSVACSTN
jgi:integrase